MTTVSIKQLSPSLANTVKQIYYHIKWAQRGQVDLVNNNPNYFKSAVDSAYHVKYGYDVKIDRNSAQYKAFKKNFVYVPYTTLVYQIGDKYVTAKNGRLMLIEYFETHFQGGGYGESEMKVITSLSSDPIWMVCDQEIYADTEAEIEQALIEAIPECKRYLYALNPDRAAYNNDQRIADKNTWDYPSKVNGKSVTIHMISLSSYDDYYGMWREEDGEYYIRLLRLVSGNEDQSEFKQLFNGLLKKEIQEFTRKESNPVIKKLLEFITPSQAFVTSVLNGELPFTFSESFNNFIGQIDDNRSKLLDWDNVINEIGDPSVEAIIVE